MDWAYISGFFDGEGGIGVDAPKDSRVPVLSVGITQKGKEVLESIARFLRTYDVSSRYAVSAGG